MKLQLDDLLTPNSGKSWGPDRGLRGSSKGDRCAFDGMKLREGGWLRDVWEVFFP